MSRKSLCLVLAAIILLLGFLACDTADTSNIEVSSTPTQPPTMIQQIEQVVPGDGIGNNVTIQYDSAKDTITVNDDIGEQWDDSTYESVGKQAIFNIQQSIWTSSLNPGDVAVNILGPLHDQYGHQSTDNILTARLTRETASQFVWDNLDSDMAWGDYDSTWILPSIQNNQ